MNGEAVNDRGARGKPERAMGKPCVVAGLVPGLDGDDSGVEERGICQGAGEERRITV